MEVPLNLPEQYLKEMKDLLGTEYDDWRSAMEEPAVTGLRTNDRKTDPGEEGQQSLLKASALSDRRLLHSGALGDDAGGAPSRLRGRVCP